MMCEDREHTIEENMLKKAEQKRLLDQHVIQEGDFTTDYFARSDWRDMLGDNTSTTAPTEGKGEDDKEVRAALAAAEDEEDAVAAKEAEGETEGRLDDQDFNGPTNPVSGLGEAGSGVATATGTGGKATPVVTFANMERSVSRATGGQETPVLGAGEEGEVEGEMEEDEDGLEGTVDGYMLKWVEEDWETYFSDPGMRW